MREVMRSSVSFVRLALVAAMVVGCAESSWQSAKKVNTVAGYHQFLRDNPDSSRAQEARERIAYLRVQARPSIEAFEAFEAEFPGSPLLDDLRLEAAPLYFQRARAENTARGYRDFLRRYPQSEYAERTRGNLVWLERVRPRMSATVLRTFIASNPESDFVLEAQHSLDLLEARRATSFQNLGVRVDIAEGIEEPERLRRGFAGLVAKAFAEHGIDVSMIEPGALPSQSLDGWMRIDYSESANSGAFGRGSLVSDCRVRLYHSSQSEPVWDRRFLAPAQHLKKGSHQRDKTIFGSAGYPFWQQFFVPASTWAASLVRVHEKSYEEPVAAIDVRGDRAALLFRSGGIEYLDVSSPVEPELIQRYRRGRDLAQWTGVKLLPGERAVLFGPNGIEMVEFGTSHARRVGQWEAGDVGSIRDTALYGETLLAASSKGLYAFRINRDNVLPHRLLAGSLVGVAVKGQEVYVVGPKWVGVASPKELLRHMTGNRLALGETFTAERAKLSGGALWVFSENRVARFDLSKPKEPTPVAVLEGDDLGFVADLAVAGPHLFLVGDRGLQVANGESWVADRIQVGADQAVAAKGRFLLLGGKTTFEVVDMSPYQIGPDAPAAPAR